MSARNARRLGLALQAAAVMALASACASASPAVSTSSTTPAPTTATVVASPSSSPVVSPSPTRPFLGPKGYGALKLGQTPQQAAATGLVDGTVGTISGCSANAHLAGYAATNGPDDLSGRLFFSQTQGLVAVYAYPGVRTPAGIHLGSTYAELHQAYPSWKSIFPSSNHDGRGSVAVPGNPNAHYRIVVQNNRVLQLSLDSNSQDCYE